MVRPLRAFTLSALFLLGLFTSTAHAQLSEHLCDTQTEDCRTPILDLIRNETVGIDVEFWFMEDARYVPAIINRFNAGVPVRLLVDSRANASKRLNADILKSFADSGIPMREKFGSDILHHKVMLFHGQNVVEFSKANYTDTEFVPITPNVNYFDEAVYFTNDDRLINSFRRRFDDNWLDTTLFRNYANVTGPLVRKYPLYPIDPSMNFPPLQDFNLRAISRIDAERTALDVIVFRVTDPRMSDAATRAVSRGVPVRLISEPTEYRNPVRYLAAREIDRLWLGGVQIKMRQHEGLTHEASIVMRSLGEVIFGSSNWTPKASAGYSDEHNFFYSPGLNKPWFYQWFADQFETKWNDTVNYVPFQPLPPDTPAYASPANGASGIGSSVTLNWDGGPWAWSYDIYLGTSPNPPLLVPNTQVGSAQPGTPEAFTVSNLQPGTTYYWRIVGKTTAQVSKSGPTFSFVTAGTATGGNGTSPFGGTPAAIPGTIQAENFDNGGQLLSYYDTTAGNAGNVYRATEDVDLEATTDVGGGYNVMKTRAGEWLTYTVNVATTGTYTLQTRIANIGTGATFHVEVDGVDRTGSIAVPDTGAWTAWQTITTPGVSLSAGQHVLRVMLDTIGTGGAVGGINWFSFTATGGTQPPANAAFGGTPAPVPGLIQAETFDVGGEGVAYHDTTAGNKGGAYRAGDVDLGPTADVGGGYYVGWTPAGEWLNYTVNVATTGSYTLETRVANLGAGATFHIEVDGIAKTGPIAVPDTGAWDAWQTISTPGVSLPAGQHVLRVVLDTIGSGGAVGGFNWFRFSSDSAISSPNNAFGGTPAGLPGIIQAENFDLGDDGVAYHDTTAGNKGGAYRSTNVDIATTNDIGGGYYIGWTPAGEWWNYTVDIATSGTYTLETRVANLGTGATFHVEVDGVDKTGPIAVPDTGAWDAWATISRPGVSLTSGRHQVRVVLDTIGTGGAVGGFNWFRFFIP